MEKRKGSSKVPSQTHVPCDYKRPIPGLEYSGNSRALDHFNGSLNPDISKMQHPIMTTPGCDEQTAQMCKDSTTSGKRR